MWELHDFHQQLYIIYEVWDNLCTGCWESPYFIAAGIVDPHLIDYGTTNSRENYKISIQIFLLVPQSLKFFFVHFFYKGLIVRFYVNRIELHSSLPTYCNTKWQIMAITQAAPRCSVPEGLFACPLEALSKKGGRQEHLIHSIHLRDMWKCHDTWGTWSSWSTPRKTNMSPENQWLEDVFPIEIVPF